jgi:hypothetical protein
MKRRGNWNVLFAMFDTLTLMTVIMSRRRIGTRRPPRRDSASTRQHFQKEKRDNIRRRSDILTETRTGIGAKMCPQ